jgi:hypothetical protein
MAGTAYSKMGALIIHKISWNSSPILIFFTDKERRLAALIRRLFPTVSGLRCPTVEEHQRDLRKAGVEPATRHRD